MKKIVSLILSTFVVVLFADEIDDMVAKINTKRDSKIPKEEFVSISSPMPKLIIENNESNSSLNANAKVVSTDNLVLKGIMNNSAFINEHWVKIGEKIGKFKIVDIMDDSVYLKDGNRSKLIFFKQKNGKIKITVGR